jgi:RNA polymerase sigma-70 factor, ECF subfamily
MYNNRIKEQYWLVRARKGDPESFGRYYDSIVDNLYQFVFFKVSNRQEAEDITSQTFLKIWEQLQREDVEIKNIRAFTYRIARNLIIDHYRQRSKYVPLDSEDREDGEVFLLEALKDSSWKQAMEHKSDIIIVYRALAKLKDEYREVIILKHINELSAREIASIVNKNTGAVRTQLSRAIIALRELLPDSFISENESINKKIKALTKRNSK